MGYTEEIVLPDWQVIDVPERNGRPGKKYNASITIKGVVFNSEVTRFYTDTQYQWQQRVFYKGIDMKSEEFLIGFGGGKIGDGTRYMVIADSIPGQLRIGNEAHDQNGDDIVRKSREYMDISARLDGVFAPIGFIRFAITNQGLLNIYDYKLDIK
jgi:hypothetical protein